MPVIVVAEVLAVAGFVANRGWEARPTGLLPPPRGVSYSPWRDPKPGLAAPRLEVRGPSGAPFDLAAPHQAARFIVLLHNTIDPSTAGVADLRRVAAARRIHVFVVLPVGARIDPASVPATLDGCKVCAEATFGAAAAYNAQWRPRAYALTGAGNLAACQRSAEALARFANRATPLISDPAPRPRGGAR